MISYIKIKFKEIYDILKEKISQTDKKMIIISISTFFIIILVLIFSKQDVIKAEKLDFFVHTQSVESFWNEIEINKQGKIMGSQEIIVSAQAIWRVKEIFVQEWQEINNEWILVEVWDTIANYKIMVDRAKNALNAARLQYSQNKSQIEQMIENNQIAIESSKNTLNTTQVLGQQNIKSAENSLQTADSQKNSIILQMESEKTKLESLLDNILHQNDTILWVTNKYKTANDSFEIYLSAKNSSFKIKWENQLLSLYKQKNILKSIEVWKDIKNDDIKNNIEKMDKTYKDIKDFLITMQNILTNSVSSTSFPQTQIDGLITSINGLQASMQSNFWFFTNLKQTIDSSLIEQNWETKIIWSESTQIWYQSTLASTEQQISNATIWLKSAELNYQSTIKNKESTLWLASSNIKSAELAYQEALKQYEKLKIMAPITWTVGKILVDKWQEISMWTPILTIINNSDPIVEMGINLNELNKINQDSKVLIEYMWEVISGNIMSIWSQAGANWLYNVSIKLNRKIDIVWDIANIKIFNQIDKFTLPINIVYPLEKNSGYVYVLQNNKPKILNITLGEVWWDRIEILSEIPANTKIITNNIWNYNPNINNLVEKIKQ
jgi:multidrug resistance efflux pump